MRTPVAGTGESPSRAVARATSVVAGALPARPPASPARRDPERGARGDGDHEHDDGERTAEQHDPIKADAQVGLRLAGQTDGKAR